ncbi:McrB family protein [Endozoicomonas euniceicola]|uniref:AAA family ATPase n=1 Tax=Endozoicomonas euniceicola TaxID=1234143 RepID=A0ABY6GSZ2_9GAMM|nr:AAA family ATPase [Endozoicomonas euniceicola]UYM15181.1 AAA family ATPase [Endozoicomonas euniceicola]
MSKKAFTGKYTLTELKEYSDSSLLLLLKEEWGYLSDEKFEVIGQLTAISGPKSDFFVLENIKNIHTGESLAYPLDYSDVRQTVFVGSASGLRSGQWVIALVELSPKLERKKHNNPFGLKATEGGLRILELIPKSLRPDIHRTEDGPALESWLLDICYQKHQERIVKDIIKEGDALRTKMLTEHQQHQAELSAESESLKSKLEQQQEKLTAEAESLQSEIEQQQEKLTAEAESLQSEIEQQQAYINETKEKDKKLSEDITKKRNKLKEIKNQMDETHTMHTHAIAEFQSQKKIMVNQLDTLNNFIKQKAQMLRDLDLIEQQDIDNMLGKQVVDLKREGHDFAEIFNANPAKAISYIQAFMWQQGIVYQRKVLEDFFALLTTHDLIVLAGDSGSGKTNLIKSFARAVGGKHVIIPVKPNWTSAEDLLGYYNPLEQKYLATQFLDALFEAARHPETPYFICLDEMNLARVEYYFADFLSLMEERGEAPEITLYSDTEATHLVSEARNFLALVDEAKDKLDRADLVSFLDILRDESLNSKLHELCGFREGDSLLKYHGQLRKLMSSYLATPSKIRLPANVRIIGAINVDETTHYLSPKILDRAHIMRFSSPLLSNWGQIEAEIEEFNLDMDLPISLPASAMGIRTQYPVFDRNDKLVQTLTHLTREFLVPLGIEFGMRTIRQARGYESAMQPFTESDALILNNIVLHKVLPKLMFDGEKAIEAEITRKDKLLRMRDYLAEALNTLGGLDGSDSCIAELDQVISNAESNDWLVNYWSR